MSYNKQTLAFFANMLLVVSSLTYSFAANCAIFDGEQNSESNIRASFCPPTPPDYHS